jgi:hypothetical protein
MGGAGGRRRHKEGGAGGRPGKRRSRGSPPRCERGPALARAEPQAFVNPGYACAPQRRGEGRKRRLTQCR